MEGLQAQTQPAGSAAAQKELRSYSKPPPLSSRKLFCISWSAQTRLLTFSLATLQLWKGLGLLTAAGRTQSFALISVGAGFKLSKNKPLFAFLVTSHSVLFLLSLEMAQKVAKGLKYSSLSNLNKCKSQLCWSHDITHLRHSK